MPTDPVIEVAGVTKTFAGVRALGDVDFALQRGEIHALVGENGAGKSTLIKVLTGIHTPDAGAITRNGHISTIYQEVNLVPLMSVSANLFLGREPRNRFGLIDRARRDADAAELLRGYGITADVSSPLGTLAVGEQQMVALARAVAADADVVIMDEPTSSLEPREVETLLGVVRKLHEAGIAIIYVSHRMDELYRICDTVTVLRDGVNVHSGPLKELPRIELVSLMLGRSVKEIEKHGTTAFGEGHHADTQPVLEARDLTSKPRIGGVSASIRPGEVVGLAGLLGSGRTETAKAIIGALPLDGGTVLVAGKPVAHNVKASMKAGISMLAEDRKTEGIIPNLSVRENIVLAALPRLSKFGVTSRSRQDRIVDTFIERLRIKVSSPEQKVAELSGGNQQKVLLARWLCTEPKILLLDEPTRGIDVGAKAEVQALIDELAREGLAVLLISSELDELLDGADRLVVLRDGSVAGELEGDQLTREHVLAAIAAEVMDDSDDHAGSHQDSH
ncbi:ribose transport system ATP-binding protein [Lentzea albidocapillata subsp. violacea]|uniref:Ribose transport system ATP-binding protein n=1 Tax=Lentzea albidocapillata subsp. violacea TaxID=128104 RepID=A0A1G9XGC4_9PSEU|nr:sugar ABC transporter ATP-binding protein [Lentzea albidocapillata]SDM95798.1 ribose transport system ATP-binding protein [Lentzea albidocapillata subsp. violacea]